MRAGSAFAGQGEAHKCVAQGLRLLRVGAQRLQCVGLACLQSGQQIDTGHLQLEQLVHIQRGGIAHHIGHEFGAQGMAAQFGKRCQCGGLHIQIGAACIRVDGLERMRDGLDLLNPFGCVLQPCVTLVLCDQLCPLGVFIGLEFVELGLQSLLDKYRNHVIPTQTLFNRWHRFLPIGYIRLFHFKLP